MGDATGVINEISGALDALSNHALAVVGEDNRAFMEVHGWNMPAMSRLDVSEYIRSRKDRLQAIDPKIVDDSDIVKLQEMPGRIEYIRNNVLGNLPGGNAQNVYIVLSSLMDTLDIFIYKYGTPPFDIAYLEDKKILPAKQLKELRNIESGINRLKVESSDLEQKVSEIKSAHAVAEALPADIQSLEDARSRYDAAARDLTNIATSTRATLEEVNKIHKHLLETEEEADRVVTRANAAYSAATTVGLGQAFADRAKSLSESTVFLGTILVLTLSGGAIVTYLRVEFVHSLMLKPSVDYNILWINVTFTALSVSAPVWLAWLLTRQIGQRFRLAEDYGYKAAVARAYEGYRAEAAQIDQELSKKLFGIALDRLAEAPLRLVEKDSPGSPAHEINGPIARFFSRQTKSDSGKAGKIEAEEN